MLVMLGLVRSVFGEVGYNMRGDARPFHNWDGAFNQSAGDNHDDRDGIVLKSDSFSIRPHIGVTVGYDDNVYLMHDDEIGDTYWSVAPGIMLVYGQENDDYITLNYAYEMTKYTDEDILDYDSHLLSVGLNLTPGQLNVHLSNQFSDSVEVDRESARRTESLQNTEYLDVSRHLTRKTSLVASQKYIINNYKNDRFLDYDEFWVGGSVYHQTFPKIKTFVSGGYGIVDMRDADVIGDADYTSLDIGIQGRLTPKSTLHAGVGLENREFKDDIETINEWTALAGLSSRLSNRTFWGIDFSRGLTPSSQRAGYTHLSTSINPSFRHIFWKSHISFSLSGAYEISDYYSPVGEEDRNDIFWYATGIVDWSPREQLITLGLGYTYSTQKSDVDEFEYEQNLVFLRGMMNY